MKLTKATVDLICELENIIGWECFNPNSYDGYTMEYGKNFKYPACYIGKDKEEHRTKYLIKDLDKKEIGSLHYNFGSNQLLIGEAIVKVLERLEAKYNLDFNELSKTCK